MEPIPCLQQVELIRLSRDIPHTSYTELSVILGFSYEFSQSILSTHQKEYNEAMMNILMKWNTKQEDASRSRVLLVRKLHDVELGGLGAKVAKGKYLPKQQQDPHEQEATPLQSSSDLKSPAPSDSVKSSGHIMLSYKREHPSQSVMREFKKQLRERGYTVWMDEDHMTGDTLEAMAEAVENADIFIACITPGYQNSKDCRTEACYAYTTRKKFVTVKISNGFNASGWLGALTHGITNYIVQQPEFVSEVLPRIIEKEFAERKKRSRKKRSRT